MIAKSNQQLSSQPLAKPQYDFNNTNHQQQSHITTTSRLSLEQAIASRLPSAKIKKATDAHPDSTDVVEAEGSGASYGLLRIGDISGVLWLPLSLAGFGILYRCYVCCSWENTLCHYCLYLLRLSEYIFVPCSPTRTLPGEVE
jgi:hypothetical protein